MIVNKISSCFKAAVISIFLLSSMTSLSNTSTIIDSPDYDIPVKLLWYGLQNKKLYFVWKAIELGASVYAPHPNFRSFGHVLPLDYAVRHALKDIVRYLIVFAHAKSTYGQDSFSLGSSAHDISALGEEINSMLTMPL